MSVRARSSIAICALALPTLVIAAACEKPPAPPHNDNLAKATVLAAATQGTSSGSTIGATRQTGEPRSASSTTVWFRWRAPSNGVVTFTGSSGLPVAIEAFTGATVNHLRFVAVDGQLEQSAFRIAKGTNYAIRVSSFAGSTFGLKWSTSSAPANDSHAAPMAIGASAGSLVTDATAATVESTDPKIDTVKAPATVWYRWTAPSTGSYDFDTHGSKASTMMGVYTDANPRQLVVDSDGGCGSFFDLSTASVRFSAIGGDSYLLMVGGSDAIADSAGPAADLGAPIQLNWRQAANAPVASGNDAFATPAHISGTNGAINGTTDGATVEAGEPATHGVPARSSVWFSWTPTVSADYVLSALPDASDACAAGLTVYTGNTLSTLRSVQSGDDDFLTEALILSSSSGSSGISSNISSGGFGTRVHLFAGTPYRIAADGFGYPGSFSLRWDIPPAAPTIRSATPGNGSVGVIWSPPKSTAGSVRTGYFVMVLPESDDVFDVSEPQMLPVTSAFTTFRGLRNGAPYRVLVAAVNGSGVGTPAISNTVTPKK